MNKRKTSIDMINGPIFKSLLFFSIPIFMSFVFQQIYNVADTFVVGKFLGEQSFAAVGSVNAVFDLINSFSLGIGNGLAIVTARAYGSHNENLLKKSVASSIVIGLVSSLLMTFICFISIRPLMHAIKVPTTLFNEAYSYIIWIILFIFVMFTYNLCAGLLRSIGDSFMPLIFLFISSFLNIFLDLLFIKIFRMGVEGTAIATVIAQGISCILCILYIKKKARILIPSRHHFKYESSLYIEMITQGYAMAFQNAIVSSGSVILQSGINNLGQFTIAGHIAARKLYMFTMMPFSALGQGIGTFVSQNKGANKPERIRKALKQSYLFDVIMALLLTVVMFFMAPLFVQFISSSTNSTILFNGSLYLRIVAPNLMVLGILIQTRLALQGIGEKLLPLFSSVIEFVGKVIFVIIFIPHFKYMAVVFCEPSIWIVMTIYLLIVFWRTPFIKSGT